MSHVLIPQFRKRWSAEAWLQSGYACGRLLAQIQVRTLETIRKVTVRRIICNSYASIFKTATENAVLWGQLR